MMPRPGHPGMMTMNETQRFLGDKTTWAQAAARLDDVQPLWGGRRVWVTGRGEVTVQVVAPGGHERQVGLLIHPAGWAALVQQFIDQDFLTISPAERPGRPDEARPTLTLTNPAGAQYSLSKWAGVPAPRFDVLYRAFLALAEQALAAGA